MLDADAAVRYWGHLARRYHNRETNIKIFLAVTSSSTVASWAIWAPYPILWHFFSGLSAVLAIALPILSWSTKVESMVELRAKWSELSAAYDQLWAQYGADPAGPPAGEMSPLKKKEAELGKTSAVLPNDRKLERECQNEVRKARGLS